jgi:hypothetical protein
MDIDIPIAEAVGAEEPSSLIELLNHPGRVLIEMFERTK